jgi:hypothetical protein
MEVEDIVGIRHQTTTGEETAEWSLVYSAVKFRVCEFFVYSSNESLFCLNHFDAYNFLIKKFTNTAFHSALLQPSRCLYLFLIFYLSSSHNSTSSYFPSGMFSFFLVLVFPQMKY